MATAPHKGRGAVSAMAGRYAKQQTQLDEEEQHRLAATAPETVLRAMQAGRIISTNESPDVPFDQSINPYQGCEHVISSYELFMDCIASGSAKSPNESVSNSPSQWARITP